MKVPFILGNHGKTVKQVISKFNPTQTELRKEAPLFFAKSKKGRDKMITHIFGIVTGGCLE